MKIFKNENETLESAIRSKTLAKIGDAIANLIFSMGKALANKEIHGTLDIRGTSKAPAIILKDGLRKAMYKENERFRVKGNAHSIADSAEAILAWAWTHGRLKIDDAAKLIANEIVKIKPKKVKGQVQAYSNGFYRIFVRIFRGVKNGNESVRS
ncbi:MAG: ribonuclease III family protein [Promethearchaeota archaeon]